MARLAVGAELHRSPVARRLLALFLICAVLPVLGLAGVVFVRFSAQLERQAQDRLHGSTKALGMALQERLLLLETELRGLDSHLQEGPDAGADPGPGVVPAQVGQRFRAVGFFPAAGGAPRALLGSRPAAPPLPARQEARLRAGGAVLVERPRPGAEPRFSLVVPARVRAGLLVGEIEPAYLADALAQHVGGLETSCVVTARGGGIGCRPEEAAHLAALLGASRAGPFAWTDADGVAQRSYHWSLFLAGSFATPSWQVVTSEPRVLAMAPMVAFAHWFLGVVGLAFGLVLLLGAVQIRRSLVPLRQLQAGTRRVAARRFDEPVIVSAGDEFADLADAFNAMAAQLDRQFRSLASRNELDRAILSAADRGEVTARALEHLPDAHPCDTLSIVLRDPDQPERATSHLTARGAGGPTQVDEVAFGERMVRLLAEHPEGVRLEVDPELPAALRPHAAAGARWLLVVPMSSGEERDAVLVLGHRSAMPDDAERVSARQLADQVSVALANARMHETVRHLAYHDTLTGLPNRLGARESLADAIAAVGGTSARVGLLFLDLDHFKRVNDTLGHSVGDRLLCAVADRLRLALDVLTAPGSPAAGLHLELARLGGDEFTILVRDPPSREVLESVANHVRSAMATPFFLGEHELLATTSVGVAVYPRDGAGVTSLFKNADAALHDAKSRGRDRVRFFSRAMNQGKLERITLEVRIRRALESGGFRLFFQPILDLRTGHVESAEALVRMADLGSGFVGPAEFIPVAEEAGLVVPIGEWVLREACATLERWRREGRTPPRISVNLSPLQVREEKFVETVMRILGETGNPPDALGLEITETTLLQGREENVAVLRRLQALGIRIYLDDFGTGYSSLSYLKRLPVDVLKVDRFFVKDIERGGDDAAIARAIVALGRSLSLRVVAEGVETQEQLAFLREHGCDAIQGFLVSAPLPAEAFAREFLDPALD